MNQGSRFYIYISSLRSLGFPHLTILSEIYTLACVSRRWARTVSLRVPKSRYTVSRFRGVLSRVSRLRNAKQRSGERRWWWRRAKRKQGGRDGGLLRSSWLDAKEREGKEAVRKTRRANEPIARTLLHRATGNLVTNSPSLSYSLPPSSDLLIKFDPVRNLNDPMRPFAQNQSMRSNKRSNTVLFPPMCKELHC